MAGVAVGVAISSSGCGNVCGVVDWERLAAGANVAGGREFRVEVWRKQRRVVKGVEKPSHLCSSAYIRPQLIKRVITIASTSDRNEESPPRHNRREWLLSSAALAAVSVPGKAYGFSRFYDVGDDSIPGTSEKVSTGGYTRPPPPVQSVDDVNTWYRFRGEGFALRIPPGYQDVLDPINEEAMNSLYGERAKDRPFAARFASPDRDEVLSVVIKPASQMQLSFYQPQDISDFGSIKEAAPKFVPGGSKLVAARIVNSKKSRIPRTYYLYEFVAKDKHVAMSAGVAGGRVFVLGATAPESRWKETGNKLRLAASSFYLP